MKKSYLFGFILFNIMGFASLVIAVYTYLELNNTLLALVLLGGGLIFIILSFVFGLSSKAALIDQTTNDAEEYLENTKIIKPSQEEPVNTEEEVSKETLSDVEVLIEETTQPTPPVESLDKPILRSDIIIKESNYSDHVELFFTTHQNSYELVRMDILDQNIQTILHDMDIYGKAHHVPEYEYRLESLLKLGLIDIKIHDIAYQQIPYVSLTQQIADEHGKKIYLVNAGITANKLMPIGYLPFNTSLDIQGIAHISCLPVTGSYKYIDSNTQDFKDIKEGLKLYIAVK